MRKGMKTIGLGMILILSAFSATRMIRTKLSGGVTVSIPENMVPMPPEDIAVRFPSVRAPLGAFTNADRLVDFSVNISATKWPDEDTDIAAKFFRSSLKNMYDRLDIISEGTMVLHKKKFLFFEFESRVSGDRRKQGQQDPITKYVYIQYLIQKDRTLVFTFSCPSTLKEEWQPVAREMMQKISVK